MAKSKAKIKLDTIAPNESNPRAIREPKFDKLKESIREFPEMMALRPLVVDKDGVLLGGNMRYRALVDLGYTEVPAEWVLRADDLTEDQKKQFIIKDNVSFGEWDFEGLANDWDEEELEKWGLDTVYGKDQSYFDVSSEEGGGGEDGGESKPSARDDEYSTYELIMFHENKLALLDTLNQIKRNFLFEKQEDALMEMVRFYNKNKK